MRERCSLLWLRAIGIPHASHLLLAGAISGAWQAGPPALAEVAPPVKVNRTVPNVKPPKMGLEFSDHPTAQEIFNARVFDEPLVPMGGEPGAEENAELAAALLSYAKRGGPDDFASLTGFLGKYPRSPWRAALLTGLGLDYYNTAHYSRALEAWQEAWALGQKATDAKGKFLADRAACELAGLYSRLGRMTELEALLRSVEKRTFLGGASERIHLAREALSMMQHQPEISFRCGPLALQSILRSDQKLLPPPTTNAFMEIFNSASTQKGFSLPQVAELSKKVGLNFQMAFREHDGTFGVPSVVHWKVGHYAAIVRQAGDLFLVEDPTFVNTVWATKQALEAETSGYFLIPAGELPPGWRSVDANEGELVWGKGVTGGNDPDQYACNNEQTSACSGSGCKGMAVSSVHLMLANLQIKDTPIGYTPPVGPPVQFTVRYNHRDYLSPPSVGGSSLSSKWTHDWDARIEDNSFNLLADVKYIVGGGGVRHFKGFDANTQTFVLQQYDQTLLKRINSSRYEMVWPDGSKRVFGLRTSPTKVALTQVVDPAGNAVTLTYDSSLRLAAITDTIGQVTTFAYDNTNDIQLITAVTDPFGRTATFEYFPRTSAWIVSGPCTNITALAVTNYQLFKITDVIGLTSQVTYEPKTFVYIAFDPDKNDFCTNEYAYRGDFVTSLATPYGVTSFSAGQVGSNANSRVLETVYPDGSRERVEYNQTTGLIPSSDPAEVVPTDMFVFNSTAPRNTFYWSRTASASSYGIYNKAKIYHWLHTDGGGQTSGILECIKEPLENRVWFNYPGQNTQGGSAWVGSSDRPTKVGRVLEDGQTQHHTYAYDRFGHLTNSIDPVGRTLSYLYATNGIDLLEIRQTRAGNNELLTRMIYNGQHRPLAIIDAAGQTNTFTYNARGQVMTASNPKSETTTYTRDADGRLGIVNGPLAGSADRTLINYDIYSRVRAITDSSGYRVTMEYDDMDRPTRITYPDATFEQFTYDRLDLVTARDRAGRQTFFEYDSLRQLKKKTDPLGRATLFDWCRCGQIKSLTDPLGRTTSWLTDVQGRNIAKQYADGSQVTYQYENATSRLKQMIDEKQQVTQFTWNRDDTLKSLAYFNTTAPTPGVSFTYDPNYMRIVSMADGIGTTVNSYNPITGTPTLGAGALASVDGPLANDTITYSYDELGRPLHRAINGVDVAKTFDEAGRLVGFTNALGAFIYGYDGSTARLLSRYFPNGQTTAFSYGNTNQDLVLQRITHSVGATPISEFLYGHDVPANRIATWSQQTGAQPPSLHTFGYDAVNQLLSATVTNTGNLVGTFAYAYDPAANRLTEQVGASNYTATYNALNEISTTTAPGSSRTNEWDGLNRLAAVTVGNQRTEFNYDGMSRRVGIRKLVNGSEVSHRRFVWSGGEICEERDATGAVTKRFFPQGVKVESGPAAGVFFYTRDHLGSIRELTDSGGNVRARYAYDPYGRRTKLAGDLETDFGFANMFWSAEANLSLTHFRAYDPELGRWLSRDPLPRAEMAQGPNLYAYVANDPINVVDPTGLAGFPNTCTANPVVCAVATGSVVPASRAVQQYGPSLQRFSSLLPRLRPAADSAASCADTVEMAIPTIEAELPMLEGLLPQAESLLPEAEPLAIRISNLSSRFNGELVVEDLTLVTKVTGWLTPYLYDLESEFYEIVMALSRLNGISIPQAQNLAVRLVGFDPRAWSWAQ